MINVDHPHLLELIADTRDAGRTDSAAFLVWYLENYYRLDRNEAVDAVGDKPGDKGIDGIWVNDNEATITVFQCRLTESRSKKVGDATLRPFAGTLRQFESQAALDDLVRALGKASLATLIKRLDLVSKIGRYGVRGEFLSNLNIDENGKAFLKTATNITFIGKRHLETRYISASREIPLHASVAFDVAGYSPTQYEVDDGATKAVIAPVKAQELVGLSGIADQSLFAYNVRGPLGKTQVNKDIVKSIRDQSLHKLFPLFHNGITVITKKLTVTSKMITTEDYFVVNGCQSLTALYENQGSITADLRVLTKFIQLDKNSTLAETVTKFSNNQNGVKSRDFMANNPLQIRLQNDFTEHYPNQYVFEIKRGENLGPGIPIPNESAGLYLMAFDLKEPWATHRRYQVFEDKHTDLFARPEVTADRIVMCHSIVEAINTASRNITNTLAAKYILTRYFMVYCIRLIIESDELGRELLNNPGKFVRTSKNRDAFRASMGRIADDLVVDLNLEIEPHGGDFDYRDKMRDSSWVKDLSKRMVGEHIKMVRRKKIKSIKEEWESRG